jgi:hypothetical protein
MTGIPARGRPHTVTRVRAPALTPDAYGNVEPDWANAARTDIAAWVQQDQRSETYLDGRTPIEQSWLLMSNDAALDLLATDRIEWAGHPTGTKTYTIEGEPEPTYTPAGFHHWECTLKLTSG